MVTFTNANADEISKMTNVTQSIGNKGSDTTWLKLRCDKDNVNAQLGVNLIRILPPTEEQFQLKMFPMTVFLHWGFTGKNGKETAFQCAHEISADPLNGRYDFKGRCPVCDQVQELYDSGDEQSKQKASKIRRKAQFLYNAIDFTDPNNIQIGILAMGPELNGEIQNQMAGAKRRDGIDIWNVESGATLEIVRTGRGFDTKSAVTVLKPEPIPQEILALCADKAKDLTKVYKKYTYEGLCEELGYKPQRDMTARVPVEKATPVNFVGSNGGQPAVQAAQMAPQATTTTQTNPTPTASGQVPIAQAPQASTGSVDQDYLSQIENKISG